MGRHFQFASFLFFVLGGLAANSVLAQTVTVNAPVVSPAQTFPAGTPPSDLSPGEAGDATLDVTAEGAAISTQWNAATSMLTVTAVDPATVSGSILVRLPDNATQALIDHENGHKDLLVEEYNRIASGIASTSLNGLVGSTFVGTGATDAERQANALAKAQANRDTRLDNAAQGILTRAVKLNNKYDDLTAHGASTTVNTAQGMAQAREERDRAVQAGNAPRQPAPQGPKAGNVDPPLVVFDPGSQSLTFDLTAALTEVTIGGLLNTTDPLVSSNSLQVLVEPMRLVGVGYNGDVLFDPSRLTIEAAGGPVLRGYLIDPTYMASSISGYAGMIQAYLDIPPLFTGQGIVNDIGSELLSSLDAVVEDPVQASTLRFWFFTDQPLFSAGVPSSMASSSGAMAFGASVPEPPTILLIIGPLIVILASTRMTQGGRAAHLSPSPPAWP